MENDRLNDKKTPEDPPKSDDDTMYVTADDQQSGQITINLEKDIKRKITIISEVEQPKRPRRGSVDLRRQAIVNNAIRSSQSTASSRSRSRSRNRSRSRGRSLSQTRSASGNHLQRSRSQARNRSRSGSRTRSRTRSRSHSQSRLRARAQSIPIKKSPKESDETPILRLPTHLTTKSVIGSKSAGVPDFIQLPSPLFILTEQQVTGASEKKTVQFVTKILLTTHKLSLDDRKKLYAEMVEAEYIGTSRSSTDLNRTIEDEPEEGYELKIYYSSKGIYIHSIQNVRKVRNGKRSKITEEKGYSNICKTKIIGDQGKISEGFLNVTCSETITAINQSYTREENFKIGLKDVNVAGNISITSTKSTFDPTKTTDFSEFVTFDNKNIGIEVRHTAIANMKDMWDHQVGSFGEEQSEYREINFFFDDGKTPKKDEKKEAGCSVVSVVQTPNNASSSGSNTSSTSSVSSSGSRKSRSRAKRHRAIKKMSEKSLNKTKSPDRETSRKLTRPDQDPIKLSAIKAPDQLNSTNNDSSFYHSFPKATSTPKSPLNNTSILQSNVKNSSQATPSPLRRGAISIREHHTEKVSDTEVDLDKSLSAKKKASASKNLSEVLESQKLEEARKKDAAASMISKPPMSPANNSVYMYNTKSANNSTYMSAKELHEDRVSASTGPKSSTISPQGIRRIKETKVIREVRQEDGKPAEVNEKKEETVKEEKVKLGKRSRSASPATPNMKKTLFSSKDDEKIVTLSAVKETHQTLTMTPIKVDCVSEKSTSSTATSSSELGQREFQESIQLEMLIDQKRLVVNLNLMLRAQKQPDVEITGFSFKGQKLWEKSSEWNISSANTTSHTKTIARQASSILEDGKDGEQKK